MASKKMNKELQPKVAVLLAAYNGEKYIKAQIESILEQDEVYVHIFISIDSSTDRTLEICKAYQESSNRISILNEENKRFGSAGKNFFYLIGNANLEDYDFVALSDQDDLWLQDKLISAINELKKNNAKCYSSDVIAIWPKKNKKTIIKKSQPQRDFDFIFEAAGPGCTYVFSNNFIIEFKKFLKINLQEIEKIKLHDWLLYSYARQRNIKWIISNEPKIYYIQHGENLVGVNTGWTAAKKRIKQIFNGEWIEQVELIQKLTHATGNKSLKFFNKDEKLIKLKALLKVNSLRRSLKDRLALSIFLSILIIKK